MRVIFLLLGLFPSLFVAQAARAVLVSIDFEQHGDGLLSRDTATGLDWLAPSRTNNQSPGTIDGSTQPGGFWHGHGFRYAERPFGAGLEESEVATLFFNAGLININIGAPIPANAPEVEMLRALLGDTGSGVLKGVYYEAPENPGGGGGYRHAQLQGEGATSTVWIDKGFVHTSTAAPDLGHFLVRNADATEFSEVAAGSGVSAQVLCPTPLETGCTEFQFDSTSAGTLLGEYEQLDASEILARVLSGEFAELDFLAVGSLVQMWTLEFVNGSFGELAASFSFVDIIFTYDETLLSDESNLAIYHFTSEGWEELQVIDRDTQANTITVRTDKLSPFVLGKLPNGVPTGGSFALILLGLSMAVLGAAHCHRVISEPRQCGA